jgi:mannose-6-phosphate isomerase-like protein (cupin superfamily)
VAAVDDYGVSRRAHASGYVSDDGERSVANLACGSIVTPHLSHSVQKDSVDARKEPSLHSHPYSEVFVLHEGRATFTVGSHTVEAAGRQIIVVLAGASHRFVNSGAGPLRHVDIHIAGRMSTDWMEE